MRYFKTTDDDFLFWKYDESTGEMLVTGDLKSGRWSTDIFGLTPDTINNTVFGPSYTPDDSFYAYECDSNWNKLEK